MGPGTKAPTPKKLRRAKAKNASGDAAGGSVNGCGRKAKFRIATYKKPFPETLIRGMTPRFHMMTIAGKPPRHSESTMQTGAEGDGHMAQIAIRRETMLAAIESFFKKVCFARKNFTQTSSNEMKGVTRMDTVKGPALSNREQLSRLIRTYEKDLLRLCCIYMKDVTLAEDAVQETFIKAYKSMDAFRGDSSARTWLIRIAINTCRDMRRGSWLRNRERTVDWERLQVPVETELATNIALTEAILNVAPK